jgi:hypothetical protein
MKTFVRFMDWPLPAKIVVLLVVASLLPLGVAAFIAIREAQQRLLANTAAVLAARGAQLVRELDTFHRSYQRSVDKFTRLPDVVEFCQAHPDHIDRLKPALQAVLAVHPASDANLRGIAILEVSGTVEIATEDQLIGLDLSYHLYVREALRGAAVISDIHVAEPQVDDAPTLAYVAPVLGPDRSVIGAPGQTPAGSAAAPIDGFPLHASEGRCGSASDGQRWAPSAASLPLLRRDRVPPTHARASVHSQGSMAEG